MQQPTNQDAQLFHVRKRSFHVFNEASSTQADPNLRIAPTSTPYQRHNGQGEIQVLRLDDIAAPADNPRLKMILTETLSINWVAYDGPRTRTQPSPRSHTDFEQGSLAFSRLNPAQDKQRCRSPRAAHVSQDPLVE